VKRPAVAMIELVFAIVIMGIVLMSAPMLITTAVSTSSVALQQESINEAASRVNMILTYPWDQNDINDSCIPPVLHVTSGDSELDEVGNTGRRIGVPLQTTSRTFLCGTNELNASFSKDGSDDIDDFAQTISLVSKPSGTGGKDYIEQTTVSMSTTISYATDAASYNSQTVSYAPSNGSASSNIKIINVILTSSSSASELNQKQIILQAFSCNIGGIEYASKDI